MNRLIIISVILIGIFLFSLYASVAVANENSSLQNQIESILQNEPFEEEQVMTLVHQCTDFTEGLGMVLNDNKISTVSMQAHYLEFAFYEQDTPKVKEALFALSEALSDLVASEQFSIQSLL